MQLNLRWGLQSFGVGCVRTIWQQSSASHICSSVVSLASFCPAATAATLPAARHFPGKLSGCVQPSCLVLPTPTVLLWLWHRLVPLKRGLCCAGSPRVYWEPQYRAAKTGYIELWGDVWGCEGYRGEDCLVFFKYFHQDNEVNFRMLLIFTIVCLKKLQVPMKNYRWGVKKWCAQKW